MDKARQKTNKILRDLEQRVNEIYITDPLLSSIEKSYHEYMDMVNAYTKDAYDAYMNEKDETVKAKLKKIYIDQVEELTLYSKEYKRLINEIAIIISDVNQKALDLINAEMPEIYMINYNQVAVDCKKVGITVNGETKI